MDVLIFILASAYVFYALIRRGDEMANNQTGVLRIGGKLFKIFATILAVIFIITTIEFLAR